MSVNNFITAGTAELGTSNDQNKPGEEKNSYFTKGGIITITVLATAAAAMYFSDSSEGEKHGFNDLTPQNRIIENAVGETKYEVNGIKFS